MAKSILFDISHPLEFHAFKHIMNQMELSGIKIYIIARNKDITHELLENQNLKYISRGKGGITIFGKVLYLIKIIFTLLKLCKKIKPSLLISFASPYLSIVSIFTGIPHIALDDTNINTITWWFYAPFSRVIITPNSFPLKLKTKQIRFPGNFEYTFLHPRFFTPDISVLAKLGLTKNNSYIIVRFVSHSSLHDCFHDRISDVDKINIVKKLSEKHKVFVSSEDDLGKELLPFKFPLHPSEIHSAIAFASLLYGESASMASEAAVLGTPSIYLDVKGRCFTEEEEKVYGLVKRFNPTSDGIEKSIDYANSLLITPDLKLKFQEKSRELLENSIDIQNFLNWFIINFPDSLMKIKNNPDFIYSFKNGFNGKNL